MLRKGILIDVSKAKIERKCTYDDKRVEDIYVKVDGKDLIPACYVYPLENEVQLQEALDILKQAREDCSKIEAEVYYKILPTLRG